MKFHIYKLGFIGYGWTWDLISNNGHVITKGDVYARKWTCLRAVKSLIKNLKDAEIVYE